MKTPFIDPSVSNLTHKIQLKEQTQFVKELWYAERELRAGVTQLEGARGQAQSMYTGFVPHDPLTRNGPIGQ